MYNRAVVESSIAQLPVIQRTGQEMLRYWQAYMSVKDAQLPHRVARTLSTQQAVVQIRFSFLVVTIGTFLLSTLAVALVRAMDLRNGVRKIHLPSSQLDWIVQAAREHVRYSGSPEEITQRDRSPTSFALRNQDLALIISPDLEPRIATVNKLLDTK